jgi:hypothetical protein
MYFFLLMSVRTTSVALNNVIAFIGACRGLVESRESEERATELGELASQSAHSVG